jgi:hypothetical protein
MNSRHFATIVVLSQTVVLAGLIITAFVGFGPAGIENSGAAPLADRPVPPLAASVEFADVLQSSARETAAPVADLSTPAEVATAAGIDRVSGPDEAEPAVEAATADSRTMPLESPPLQVATAGTSDPIVPGVPADAPSTLKILDGCASNETCIDRYLWALYQRTPKEDSIKVYELKKVKVRKRGRMVTVTRTSTRLVDEDFAWKDPKAAEKAGLPMMEYVIGGMDRSFKLRLFHMMRAADEAGLSPGITSAFRDDYRQSIASGLKAASDRSYHGGSFRGGYGHGLAADVVSVRGGTRDERWNSSESFWNWIDAHGKEFGIGRPYMDRDPPHVAPIDGKEYASHHGATKVHHARSDVKKRNRLAARNEESVTKRPKTARSKVKTI